MSYVPHVNLHNERLLFRLALQVTKTRPPQPCLGNALVVIGARRQSLRGQVPQSLQRLWRRVFDDAYPGLQRPLLWGVAFHLQRCAKVMKGSLVRMTYST